MPGLGCLDADADREMGFAGAWRSEQDHVFGFRKERPGAQMRDEVPVRGGLVVEVELFQILVGREPCGLDPGRRSGGFAFGDFTGEDRGQVLLMGPASLPGLVPEPAEPIADPRCSQCPGVVLDL